MTADPGKHEPGREPPRAPAPQPQGSPSAGRDRRAILKAGLGAAPIILTLSNRSAFAQACTPSANVSLALGTSLTHEDACNGLPASYWTDIDHAAFTGLPFAQVFARPWNNDWPDGITLQQVILLPDETADPLRFGQHAATAWLNATVEPNGEYPMAASDVEEMVNAILIDGVYHPRGAQTAWMASDVVTFIQTTFVY